MKKLGIFAFYDNNGYVGRYVEFLLNEIMTVIDRLVVVINGTVSKEGENIFKSFTPYIIFRRNVGYDAGAYKEALIEYLGKEKIKDYDQIVLFNNTFYGPFIPFKQIFDRMDREKADFWGLNYVDDHIGPHMESYFLVINQRIIDSGKLFEFFLKYIDEDETEFDEIYAYFEVGLTEFFLNNGFSFSVYSKKNRCNIYRCSNFLIKEYGLPIFKRKCFSKDFFREATIMDTLQYIHFRSNYDIDMILEDARQNYHISYAIQDVEKFPIPSIRKEEYPIAQADRKQIIRFLSRNHQIYIYGAGIIARKIFYLYSEYFMNVKGVIVSDDQLIDKQYLHGYPIIHLSNVDLSESAVLVALNKENTNAVKGTLESACSIVFSLW